MSGVGHTRISDGPPCLSTDPSLFHCWFPMLILHATLYTVSPTLGFPYRAPRPFECKYRETDQTTVGKSYLVYRRFPILDQGLSAGSPPTSTEKRSTLPPPSFVMLERKMTDKTKEKKTSLQVVGICTRHISLCNLCHRRNMGLQVYQAEAQTGYCGRIAHPISP